jgi:hypothetical protein
MPLPIGQAIAFFYYDPRTERHEILSSYYKVPYVPDRQIEAAANKLLGEFQAERWVSLSTYDPPAKYLGKIIRFLGFDMEPRDLHWELGPNVIAATEGKNHRLRCVSR